MSRMASKDADGFQEVKHRNKRRYKRENGKTYPMKSPYKAAGVLHVCPYQGQQYALMMEQYRGVPGESERVPTMNFIGGRRNRRFPDAQSTAVHQFCTHAGITDDTVHRAMYYDLRHNGSASNFAQFWNPDGKYMLYVIHDYFAPDFRFGNTRVKWVLLDDLLETVNNPEHTVEIDEEDHVKMNRIYGFVTSMIASNDKLHSLLRGYSCNKL